MPRVSVKREYSKQVCSDMSSVLLNLNKISRQISPASAKLVIKPDFPIKRDSS